MAIVKGVNCGFVSAPPSGDPGGTDTTVDNTSCAFKDVSPSDAVKVTEIGFWCDNATEESNLEVGIYDHHVGDDNPEDVVGWDKTNAKGTSGGEWKRVTGLDIAISGNTIYWIATQIDYTVTRTKGNRTTDGGERYDVITTESTLLDPWGASSAQYGEIASIYAVYETAGGGGPGALDFERKTRGVGRGVMRGAA